MKQGISIDSAIAERDKLKKINKELLAVLKDIADQKPSEWQGGFMEWVQEIAEAVIAKTEND